MENRSGKLSLLVLVQSLVFLRGSGCEAGSLRQNRALKHYLVKEKVFYFYSKTLYSPLGFTITTSLLHVSRSLIVNSYLNGQYPLILNRNTKRFLNQTPLKIQVLFTYYRFQVSFYAYCLSLVSNWEMGTLRILELKNISSLKSLQGSYDLWLTDHLSTKNKTKKKKSHSFVCT